MERMQFAREYRVFALYDLESFEGMFGQFDFYRVIEANKPEQVVKIMTGEHLRRVAEVGRNGSFDNQQKARSIMLQPVFTWKPDKTQ